METKIDNMLKNQNNTQLNSLNASNKQKFKTLALEIPSFKKYIMLTTNNEIDIEDGLLFMTVNNENTLVPILQKLAKLFNYNVLWFDYGVDFNSKEMIAKKSESNRDLTSNLVIKTTKLGLGKSDDVIRKAEVIISE